MRTLLLILLFFFFNDTATTEIYTLSLHDALPIFSRRRLYETGTPEVQGPVDPVHGRNLLPPGEAFAALDQARHQAVTLDNAVPHGIESGARHADDPVRVLARLKPLAGSGDVFG